MTATRTLTLRRATDADEPFVRRVFVEASNAALVGTGLAPQQLTLLLDLQYAARAAQWQAAHSSLQQHVLERDGEPVGVCCLATDGSDDLRVVDLAVLPEHQRQGIASEALRQVVASGGRVRLSVWQDDLGARALYEAAGFRPDRLAGNGYLELVREPTDQGRTP